MVKFPGEIMSSFVAVTIITGVLVFVNGQLIIKGAVEPYIEFKKRLGKTSNLLLASQAKLANPCAVGVSEIIHELEDAAVQLIPKRSALLSYIKKFHIGFRSVPSAPKVISSAQKLDLIASIHEGRSKGDTYGHIAEIGRMLKIPTTCSL